MQVIFDIGNVLLTYQPEQYFRSRIHDPVLYGEVAAIFHTREWAMLDQGLLTYEEAAERMGKTLTHLGKDGVYKILENWIYCMHPLPGTEAMLDKLEKNGIPFYYLSNYHREPWDYTLRSNPFFRKFADGIASWEVKLLKPGPEIYQTLLEKYGLRPEECVFTDDTPKNVAGAKAVGIDAFVFLNTAQCEKELRIRGLL